MTEHVLADEITDAGASGSEPPPAAPEGGPGRRARIRAALGSRQDLRDLFLLQEILGTPVGARRSSGASTPSQIG